MTEGLNWNLLRVLHVLLTERSISSAAKRLQLSQPAVSANLRTLRLHFDDPLLVRQGAELALTPRAAELLPLIATALAESTSVLGGGRRFDPRTARRTFVLAASDYVQAVLGSLLVRELERLAPLVHVEFQRLLPEKELARSLAHIDGAIVPHHHLVGHPSVGSFRDRWVCVLDQDHPALASGRPALADAIDPGESWWIVPGGPIAPDLTWLAAPEPEAGSPPMRWVSDSTSAIPFLVAGSRDVGLVPESLAIALGPATGTRLASTPVPLAPLRLTMRWHRDRQSDPSHDWFRHVVTRVASGAPVEPRAESS